MKKIKISKVYIMNKKDAFKDANGEYSVKGAPYGTRMKVNEADVVAVVGRGSKVQILKNRTGYVGVGRVSPVKFLRMLADGTI